MKQFSSIRIFFAYAGIFFFLFAIVLSATAVAQTSLSPFAGDIVLEPAKIERTIDPGSSADVHIFVTNRTDQTLNFVVNIEDFEASPDPLNPVVLLGEAKSSYSLTANLTLGVERFALKPGERAAIPVSIKLPANTPPGGLYAAVLVSTAPEGETVSSGARSVSRLGSLLFIKVSGAVEERGQLIDVRLGNLWDVALHRASATFDLFFENKGNVHLIPYGVIKIENLVSGVVSEVGIDPYFVLPNSVRHRPIMWSEFPPPGFYRATVFLNRGYNDIVDEHSVTFLVFPPLGTIVVAIVVFLLLGVLVLVRRRGPRNNRLL